MHYYLSRTADQLTLTTNLVDNFSTFEKIIKKQIHSLSLSSTKNSFNFKDL